ncbi:hypothetical protein ACFL6U_24180 [Planctomycetota bacterium]
MRQEQATGNQCAVCLHYKGTKPLDRGIDLEPDCVPYCQAYPHGIPDAITEDQHNHKRPFPGDQGITFERAYKDTGPHMVTSIAGHRYDTTTANLIYRWTNLTLYQIMRKRRLFLHHYSKRELERIEPITREDAVALLQTRGDPTAVDLLYEQSD